jgi:hypothetical protein
MKIQCFNKVRLSASALVITLTVVVITAIMLGSYLTLVQYQTASVARSQAWNSIIPLTEAGIEEGMAMINGGTSNLDTSGMGWTNNSLADNWALNTNSGAFSVTRYVGGTNAYYTTTVIPSTTMGVGPTVTAQGYVSYTSVPWLFGSNTWAMNSAPGSSPFFLAAAGTASSFTNSVVSRKLMIQTTLSPLFAVGIACKSNFNMNGKNCRVDSYDSTATNTYSTAATVAPSNNVVWIYDPLKAKSGGDVGVDAAILGDVNTGNGSIYGHLHTGPGDVIGNVQMGPNGVVGAIGWAPSGNPQIEDLGTPTSWWTPDFNVNFPDVKTPNLAGALSIPGATNGYIFLSGGSYIWSTSWNNSTAFMVTAPTTLWVKGSITGLNVVFAGTNASLVLYVGRPTGSGDAFTLVKGNGTLNSPGYARNLQIFGLPSLTSLDLSGNNALTAAVYAPNAVAIGGGGGNNTQDMAGAIVVKALNMNGHWNFHYDESLKTSGTVRGWVAKNWTEVKPD